MLEWIYKSHLMHHHYNGQRHLQLHRVAQSPRWSCAGCLESSPCLPHGLAQLLGRSSLWSSQAQRYSRQVFDFQVSPFLPRHKGGSNVFVFLFTRDFTWLSGLLLWLAWQLHQTHLIRSQRLRCIHIPGVHESDLFIQWKWLYALSASFQLNYTRAVGREIAREDWAENLSTLAFFLSIVTGLPVMFIWGMAVHILWPSFSDILIETLIILHTPWQVQLQLWFGLSDPSLHKLATSLYSFQDTCPCFLCQILRFLTW